MTDKERLTNIIHNAQNKYLNLLKFESSILADYLLANGVIVPPCKVGQIVWLDRDGKIEETTVEKIVLKYKGLYLKLLCNSFYETTCRSIGKTVFLTREEAEKELDENK